MDDSEEKFIKENFKAGDFVTLTILVRTENIQAFLEYLNDVPMKLAVLASAQQSADFHSDDDGSGATN